MRFDTSIWEKLQEEKLKARERCRLETLQLAFQKLKEVFENMKVKSVYIFGSLLKENHFGKFSDIDIAVEGLDPKLYFEVYVLLEEIFHRNIDLVELEKCKFKEMIEQKGIKIV